MFRHLRDRTLDEYLEALSRTAGLLLFPNFGGGGETAITLFETYCFSTPCGFSVHFVP